MKPATPRWWYVRSGAPAPVLRALLRPLSWVWAAATARRIARTVPAEVGAAVVCVGNLTVGGAGKTPVVREVLRLLRARGVEAHGLSRGHGGSDPGPRRVSPADPAREVGDEAVMLAGDGPFWIARDRAAGARAAAAAGAEVVVMDDGHQNPSVRKALSLVVVDGETRDGEWPFGDGAVFPAGPLREPLAAGLTRADAVVLLLPADLPQADPGLAAVFGDLPVWIARLEPAGPRPQGRWLAFAGVGKPWKVERALRAAGLDLVDFAAWPDHHPYAEADLRAMSARAAALDAGLLTTEKDAARLSAAWRARVAVWSVRVRFDHEKALAARLSALLRRADVASVG